MQFDTAAGRREIQIDQVIVAGWTGRDRSAVEHHIEELAALGVAPPSEVPLYYRVSNSLLTQSPTIQVLGPDTSGEVEPLVLRSGGRLFLGLASDHTDRALEATSVAASKQICPKPVAASLWPWEDIKDHLDQLILATDILEMDGWTRYQAGALNMIQPLSQLIASVSLPDNTAMLCGTLAAIGGVRPAEAYRMTLTDPVMNRGMSLDYEVTTLPVIS